jgi:hypothetical protein
MLTTGLSDASQAGLMRCPRLGVEVAAQAAGHVVVGHPLLGHRQMPVQQLRGDRFQLAEQVMVGMTVRYGRFPLLAKRGHG